MSEHKAGKAESFTRRYRINRLVYFEDTNDVQAALQREKQVKAWTRQKRIDLINSMNPKWLDLSDGWLDDSEAGLDSLDSSPGSE
jgi:putative endonuclease